MSEEKTTGAGWEETSDTALSEHEQRVARIAQVLSRMVKRDPNLLNRFPGDLTHKFYRPLGWTTPSPFDLIDAYEELGLVYYSGRDGGFPLRREFAVIFPSDTACVHTPDDMRRELAHELRVKEAKRRREIAARRRRDAEKLGLSAEESDAVDARLAELWFELGSVQMRIWILKGDRGRRPKPGTSGEKELAQCEDRLREIEEEFRRLRPGTREDFPEHERTFFYVFDR
jgi:hypothetical protein